MQLSRLVSLGTLLNIYGTSYFRDGVLGLEGNILYLFNFLATSGRSVS